MNRKLIKPESNKDIKLSTALQNTEKIDDQYFTNIITQAYPDYVFSEERLNCLKDTNNNQISTDFDRIFFASGDNQKTLLNGIKNYIKDNINSFSGITWMSFTEKLLLNSIYTRNATLAATELLLHDILPLFEKLTFTSEKPGNISAKIFSISNKNSINTYPAIKQAILIYLLFDYILGNISSNKNSDFQLLVKTMLVFLIHKIAPEKENTLNSFLKTVDSNDLVHGTDFFKKLNNYLTE